MRRLILALAGLIACCACSIAGGADLATAATAGTKAKTQRAAAIAWLGGQILGYERSTWHWNRLMGVPRVQTEGRVFAAMSIADIQRAVRLWQQRAAAARRQAAHPPHEKAFLCIHHYEGSWTDGNGAVLRRPADGSRLPADVRPVAPPDEGDGRPLDAARADLDGGAGRQEQGFLALAEHSEVLRAHLTPR